MSGKEAKRYRKMMRGTVESSTRAKFHVLTEKAKRAIRMKYIYIGTIIALVPANLWAAFRLLREVVK